MMGNWRLVICYLMIFHDMHSEMYGISAVIIHSLDGE